VVWQHLPTIKTLDAAPLSCRLQSMSCR